MIDRAPREGNFPSPYDWLNIPPAGERGDSAAERRAARRAEILAIARALIIKRGFNDFTVKELSEHCGLSKQTLHNHFVDKVSILATAINDYSLALYRYTNEKVTDTNPIFAFTAAFATTCERYPEFFSRILPSTFFEKSGALVYTRTHGYGTIMLQRALRDVCRKEMADDLVDVRVAAGAITDAIGETLLSWARGAITTENLAYNLCYKIELVLAGLLRTDRMEVTKRAKHCRILLS